MRTKELDDKIEVAKRELVALLLELEIDDLSDAESKILYELAINENIQKILGD